jgi:excisionase family DNA binding protein
MSRRRALQRHGRRTNGRLERSGAPFGLLRADRQRWQGRIRCITHARNRRKIGQRETLTKALFHFAVLRDTVRMRTPESASFSPSADVVASPAVTPETLTYSVAEAAMALGVSAPTVYRLITRRILRPLDCLRHKRIPKRQVYDLLNNARL